MSSLLYVSDLDGTLLGPKAVLSEYSRQALCSMIGDGLLFTVATARTTPSIRALLGNIRLPLPVIELNGAYLSDLQTGRHLAVNAMAPDVAADLVARIQRRGLHAFAATCSEDEDHLYYGDLPNPAMQWYRDEKHTLRDPRLRQIVDPRDVLREQVVSMTLLGERDAMMALAAEIRSESASPLQLHMFENLYCPGWWELSVQDRRASKSEAIATLRQLFDLVSHGLVVFGDGLNDLDMFATADHAVAVGNAVPEIVAAAHEVTGRHDQDGVVCWIANALATGMTAFTSRRENTK